RLSSLAELPIMRHQPRDAGPYFTSAITCLLDPASGKRNLGFYRVEIKGPDRGALFADPRTDAHRILTAHWQAGANGGPVTRFIGGPLSCYLSAAANVPAGDDTYEFASWLSDRPIALDQPAGGLPPAPADAEVVIRGHLRNELIDEAPFGEFKGYYCKPTRCPVLVVE